MPSCKFAVLATVLFSTACAGAASEGDGALVVDYTPLFQAAAAAEYEALAGGIGWAKEQARKRSEDIAHIEVRSKLVAEASNYVIERVPDAVNRFGLDRERIEQLIEARLGGA